MVRLLLSETCIAIDHLRAGLACQEKCQFQMPDSSTANMNAILAFVLTTGSVCDFNTRLTMLSPVNTKAPFCLCQM